MEAQSAPLQVSTPIARSNLNPTFVLDGSVDGGLVVNGIDAKRLENVPESVRNRFPSGVTKRTAFSVLSKGGLADRFFLDVDYKKDDRIAESDEDSKILLRYQGKPGEVLKSLELGDTTLDLPGSRWLSLKGKTGKVSRSSFAGKGIFGYRDLEMTVIGAHQKGKPEFETFDLGSALRRVEIRDTDYIQRRYYQIAPASDLPLDPQSITIFYDDQNGFNNTEATQRFTPAGSAKEGFFDPLIPNDSQRGYEIDSRTGVARFLFDVPFNGALAVSYRTAFGKTVTRQLIKSDDNAFTTELKNRYILPSDFLDVNRLSVEDKSGSKVATPDFSFDSLRKLIVFTSSQPFSSEVYQFPPSSVQTIILSYLSSGDRATIYLAKEPIPETVQVERNGIALKEGDDYVLTVGGGRGFLDLFGGKPNDKITVGYNSRDVPLVRQTVGGAVVYGKDKPLTIGLSGLYDFAPRSTRVPQVGSDVPRVQMFGTSLKGNDLFGKTKVSLNIEAAGSRFDPNPYGASMVDNFDSTRRSLEMEMREEFWKPSARPPAAIGARFQGLPSFGSVFLREILPNNPTDRREQIITFQSNAGEWFGIHRAIAPKKGTVDLRPYRQIELFVFSDGNGGTFNLEWGDVSEDSNGNSRIDTEDSNRDGLVDESEDSGILLENGTLYGAGNRLLDTEDIDLNGRLDTTESSNIESVNLNWIGWKKLRFSLRNVSSARSVRLWTQGNAKVSVARVEFVGMEYIEEKSAGSNLTLATVSNFSDPDAPSLNSNPTFQRLYPDRDVTNFDKSEFERKRLEDFGLSLDYSVLPGGEVSAKKDVQMDFSNQKEVHFFAASTGPTNGVLFVRLGNRSDYFEFSVAVDNLTHFYQEFSVVRSRFKTVGNPDWQNIREIRIGVTNPSSSVQSGRLFFNDLFMDQSIVREALAVEGESAIEHPLELDPGAARTLLGKAGNLFLEMQAANIPSDFRTPDELLRGEKRYGVKTGWKSDQTVLRYTREETDLKELLSNSGTFSGRLSKSFARSDRMDWEFRPRLLDWETNLTGNFVKRERSELNLSENVERTFNHLNLTNNRLQDYFPKRIDLENTIEKNLSLGRNTLGGNLSPRWSAFDGDLALNPLVGFEETVQSSSSLTVVRKANTGVTGSGQAGPVHLDGSATSENQFRRSDYPSLQNAINVRCSGSVSLSLYGRTGISAGLGETRIFTSSEALSDPGTVWKYLWKVPGFESQSFNQSRDLSIAQENIRLFRIMEMPEWDVIGLTLRAGVKEENRRFAGIASREDTVKFPDTTVVYSSGPWTASVGNSYERLSGTDKKGETTNTPISLEYRRSDWEIRGHFNMRNEFQERFDSAILDLKTLDASFSGKIAFGQPIYQTFGWIRKNIFLHNRTEINWTLDLQDKKGVQNHNPIDELTGKLSQKCSYSIRESVKSYVLFEGWLFKNRVASAYDYFAYSATVGLFVQF